MFGRSLHGAVEVGALVAVPEQVAEGAGQEASCVHEYVVLQGRKDEGITSSDLSVTKEPPQHHIIISFLN